MGIADLPASLVQRIPDRQLELLMRTPARRIVVETIFLLMPRYLDRTRAANLDLAVRWQVGEAERQPDIYDLVIAEQRCRVRRGESDVRPLVTISIEPAELLRVAVGRCNPVQAYLTGRLRLHGDLTQAARLTSVFRIPVGARP